MANEPASNDLGKLWRTQIPEPVIISPDELHQKARKLQKTVFRRNVREYVALALGIASFGYYFLTFHSALVRLGCSLTIAGILYVAYQLHKRVSARSLPADMALNTCLAFHRAELDRQRRAVRNVWKWYLLPFVPGMLLFLVGLFVFVNQQPGAHSHAAIVVGVFGLTAAAWAGVFVLIAKLNQSAARKLDRQIEMLDAMTKEL